MFKKQSKDLMRRDLKDPFEDLSEKECYLTTTGILCCAKSFI